MVPFGAEPHGSAARRAGRNVPPAGLRIPGAAQDRDGFEEERFVVDASAVAEVVRQTGGDPLMQRSRLDRYDLAILCALQRDGRMSKVRLAEIIHLTPTPCWERLRRLERDGFIRGYHAEVAVEALLDIERFLVEVTLTRHRPEDFARFEAAVAAQPRVLACFAVAGGFDYLLTVVADDALDYQRMMDAWLGEEVGVERYFTYVVTRTVKAERSFPLESFWTTRRRAE